MSNYCELGWWESLHEGNTLWAELGKRNMIFIGRKIIRALCRWEENMNKDM